MDMKDHTKMIIVSSFLILIVILCASPSKGASLNSLRINTIEKSALWPNAVVPYYINENDFDAKQKAFIMTSFLRFASSTCLKFLPVTAQPETYERIIIMENPNRLVKCPLHSVLHSKAHNKVTLASDCLRSPEFDLIIMHALGSQFNQVNDNDVQKHFHGLHSTHSLVCQQRDHQERAKYCEIIRQKRGIDENREIKTNYTNITTTKENISDSYITENESNNTAKPNTAKGVLISLVKELGIDKKITDIINKLHKIGYVSLLHVRNKYCNKSALRTDFGNVKVKKGLILNEADHSFKVGDIFQYIINNVSSDRISFAGHGQDRLHSQYEKYQPYSGGVGFAGSYMGDTGEVPPEVLEAIYEAPPDVIKTISQMSQSDLEKIILEEAIHPQSKVMMPFSPRPVLGKGLKDIGKKFGNAMLDLGIKEYSQKAYDKVNDAAKSVWKWMKNIG